MQGRLGVLDESYTISVLFKPNWRLLPMVVNLGCKVVKFWELHQFDGWPLLLYQHDALSITTIEQKLVPSNGRRIGTTQFCTKCKNVPPSTVFGTTRTFFMPQVDIAVWAWVNYALKTALSSAQKFSLLCSKLCSQNQDYAQSLTLLLEYIGIS